MFLFLRFIGSANETFYFGAINTPINPYMSGKLPGFHICPNKKIEIEYSYTERKIPLKFNQTSENGTKYYDHCHLFVSEEHLKKFNSVLKPNSFLTFYYNHTMSLSPIFSKQGNDIRIFTHFQIKYPKNSDQFQVIPSELQLVKPDTMINISFSLNILPEISETESTNILPSILYTVSVMLFAIAVMLIVCYSKNFQNMESFDIGIVWGKTRSYPNMTFFAQTGLTFIAFIFCISHFIGENEISNTLIYNSLLFCVFITSPFIAYVCRCFGDLVGHPEIFSPAVCPYLFFVFPHRVLTLLDLILDMFRGPNMIFSILGDIFFFSAALFIAHHVLWLYIRMRRSEGVKQPVIPKDRMKTRIWTIWTYIMCIIAAVLIFPAINDVITNSYNNIRPNYQLMFPSLLVLVAAISIPAIKKTALAVKSETESWLSCITSEANFISILTILETLGLIYLNGAYKSFFSVFNMTLLFIGIVVVVYVVAIFASFAFGLLFVSYTFPLTKLK